MKNTKKSKKQKVKFESGDWRQALDYSCVMMTAYYHTMRQCNVLLDDPELQQAFELVGDAMNNLYQAIGTKAFAVDEDLANDY